jgi:hypothetical protein
MTLLAILSSVALTLMVIAYWIRRPAIGVASGVMWWIASAQSYTLSTAMWDVYFAFYVVTIGLGIVASLEGFVLKPRKDQIDEAEQMFDEDKSDWRDRNDRIDKFNKEINMRRYRRRKVV